jgi:hypothetical protein
MKRLLLTFIVLIAVISSYAQRIGDYDKNSRVTDTLETEDVFMYQNVIIPVLDISYHEWSADGSSWHKEYTSADSLLRVSNDTKTSWVVLNYKNGIRPYWILDDNGNLYTNGDLVTNNVGIDTTGNDFKLDVNGNINMWGYPFINGDSLTLTNIYNGGDSDNGYVLTYSGDTALWQPLGSGYGETNLMTNAGARGVGVYDNKIDSLFNMRNIASLTSMLTVALGTDSVIDLDLVLHNVIAGVGLQGGGSMEGDVTINLYIPELPETTTLDKDDDLVAIYDNSEAAHRSVNPELFQPDVYVNKQLAFSHPNSVNFTAGTNVGIVYGGDGVVTISATGTLGQTVDLFTNDTLRKSQMDTLNIIEGDNITVSYTDNGDVTIASEAGLPTCDEGQILMYLSGEWTCVELCDYICADTIISIINNYNDTVPSYIDGGNVYVNFDRSDCLDTVYLTASQFVSSTTNLTNIIMVSIPTIGTLKYNSSDVVAGDTLDISGGSFDYDLFYVADDGTGSAYVDAFTFKVKYASNDDYLNTFNIDVSVDACVGDMSYFITEWDMPSGDFTLPLVSTEDYDMTVDWGDGSSSVVTSYNDPDATHTYLSAETLRISISGICEHFQIKNNTAIKDNITKVIQWGEVSFEKMDFMFQGCTNLTYLPDGAITGVEDVLSFRYMFYGCTSITSIPELFFSESNGSHVGSISATFALCASLVDIPDDLFSYTPNAQVSTCFYKCTALEELPDNFLVNIT